jgi:hypothetical protein
MKSKYSLKQRLFVGAGGALAIALAAGGMAYAAAPSAVPAAASTSQVSSLTAADVTPAVAGTPATRQKLRADIVWLVRHTVHATLVVDAPTGYETLTIDRGTLNSASSTSISMTDPDGTAVSAAVTSTTKWRGLPEASVHSGDRVVLVQTGGKALVVWSRAPASTATTKPAGTTAS